MFARSRSLITYPYTLNGSNLIPVYSGICDLNFTFTSFLCSRAHIDKITCKALEVLGFVKRISGDFKPTTSLKSIYCALVRPIIEYGILKQLMPVYNYNGFIINFYALWNMP
ncbi:unnamed protein product [Macrosiphum euphorbiae]|nr:unnamed protein product [Macrosiphum euphorbiae]